MAGARKYRARRGQRPTKKRSKLLFKVARLRAPEERLLGAEDLHRAGGLLGQVDQAARVRDQARAHQLADQHLQSGA